MKTTITLLSLMLMLTGCATKIENTLVLDSCESDIGVPLFNEEDSNATAQEGALDKSALLALLSGSTVYQNNNDFVKVGFYSEDNTMTGNVWGSWENQIDKGSWMVNEDGQFCNQWQGVWSQGEAHSCYQVFPGDVADQYMMVSSSDDQNSLQVFISRQNEDEFE